MLFGSPIFSKLVAKRACKGVHIRAFCICISQLSIKLAPLLAVDANEKDNGVDGLPSVSPKPQRIGGVERVFIRITIMAASASVKLA